MVRSKVAAATEQSMHSIIDASVQTPKVAIAPIDKIEPTWPFRRRRRRQAVLPVDVSRRDPPRINAPFVPLTHVVWIKGRSARSPPIAAVEASLPTFVGPPNCRGAGFVRALCIACECVRGKRKFAKEKVRRIAMGIAYQCGPGRRVCAVRKYEHQTSIGGGIGRTCVAYVPASRAVLPKRKYLQAVMACGRIKEQ